MWVRFPVAALVSLSKTLNHNSFVLRMGHKAVGPVCCVIHVKEPSTLIVKRRGLPRCFWLAPRNRQLDWWRFTNVDWIGWTMWKYPLPHPAIISHTFSMNAMYFRHVWSKGSLLYPTSARAQNLYSISENDLRIWTCTHILLNVHWLESNFSVNEFRNQWMFYRLSPPTDMGQVMFVKAVCKKTPRMQLIPEHLQSGSI